MAIKFSQFDIGTASATAYVVGYDGSANVRIPATDLSPSGTPGYLPKYASPSGLANSLISDDGSNVTVNGYLITNFDAVVNGLVLGRGNGSLPSNVAFGISALSSNYSGSASVSVGAYSLSSNFAGNNNVAIGAYAMQLSGQANNNVAIGQSALNGLTGISGNTDTVAIGHQAMLTKTGVLGAGNVAIGTLALAEGGGTGGSNNTGVGTQALRTLQSGTRNVAVGYQSQRFNVSGGNNVSVGWQGLYNVTGSQNVGIGYLSGYLITTGSNNVVIGGNSGSSINTLSNFMLFADGAGNERFRIPSTGNVLIGTTTDAGYKLDVSGNIRASTGLNVTTTGVVSPPWDANFKLNFGLQYGNGWTSFGSVSGRTSTLGITTFNESVSDDGSVFWRVRNNGGTAAGNPLFQFDFENNGTLWAANRALFRASNLFLRYRTLDASESWIQASFQYQGQGVFYDNTSSAYTTTSSALLELNSTKRGFLPPRMTDAQITAIASPAAGLVVYSTTALTLAFYNGTAWRKVTDTAL